jgi:hypothetical protein
MEPAMFTWRETELALWKRMKALEQSPRDVACTKEKKAMPIWITTR